MSLPKLLRSFRVYEPWTWFASLGFFAFLQQFIPHEYTDGLRRNLRLWLRSLIPYVFCDVHEYDSSTLNTLYPDVEIYLSSLTAQAAQRVNLSKPKNAKEMTFTMANDQRTKDRFNNANVEWLHRVYERQRPMWTAGYQTHSDEKRSFTLQIWRKDKHILDNYMAHIQARAKELKRSARDLLLYTNSKGRESYFSRGRPWESVNFVHPATFDTLALDGDMKTRICDDLDKFANGEAYYRRVGKAWKRGYLLYGPPGTGKSSMIAAIANKMRYDVYDLELTEVESNIELRKLLLHTNNKSVIVIEDIDCSLDLSGQRKKKKKKPANEPSPVNPTPMKPQKEQSKVTLSGLLNFVDGLWSCCGSERIFIFTTNYVEKLDPALLRAGRMDMHIHLSYCTFSAFKVLARNYLQIPDHELFDQLRTSFEGSYMTPAEVSEVLIKEQECPTPALESLLAALDEHRVKPQPPPPDSDDEKEDEKDVGSAAAPENEKKITEVTDDAVVTATEIKEQKKEPAESFTGDKQTLPTEKIHPTEDPVENKGEVPTTKSATENGETGTENMAAAVQPASTGDAVAFQSLNGEVPLSRSASKKSGGATNIGGEAAAAPHSTGTVGKVPKENGVVANGTSNGADNHSANGVKSAAALETAVN